MAFTVGKGHKRRPSLISKKEYESNWDKVFGKKKKAECTKECKDGCKQATQPIHSNI